MVKVLGDCWEEEDEAAALYKKVAREVDEVKGEVDQLVRLERGEVGFFPAGGVSCCPSEVAPHLLVCE